MRPYLVTTFKPHYSEELKAIKKRDYKSMYKAISDYLSKGYANPPEIEPKPYVDDNLLNEISSYGIEPRGIYQDNNGHFLFAVSDMEYNMDNSVSVMYIKNIINLPDTPAALFVKVSIAKFCRENNIYPISQTSYQFLDEYTDCADGNEDFDIDEFQAFFNHIKNEGQYYMSFLQNYGKRAETPQSLYTAIPDGQHNGLTEFIHDNLNIMLRNNFDYDEYPGGGCLNTCPEDFFVLGSEDDYDMITRFANIMLDGDIEYHWPERTLVIKDDGQIKDVSEYVKLDMIFDKLNKYNDDNTILDSIRNAADNAESGTCSVQQLEPRLLSGAA